MKLLEIVVPTYNRPKEINRFLDSTQNLNTFPGWEFGVRVRYGQKPEALTQIVNGLVSESKADAVMVLADHLVMHSDCFEKCLPFFEKEGLDRMIGLHIENLPITPGVSEYCFFVLGKEFIGRFPNKQIFCPDYYHFYADNELGQYAHASGCFIWAEQAKVTTFHPNVGNAPKDDTYWASRKNVSQDKQTNSVRKSLGLHWGFSFQLAKEEGV